MVSARCIALVKHEMENLGFHLFKINLGELIMEENISETQLNQIKSSLLESGFELLENKKDILVQQIKNNIIHVIYNSDEPLVENLSIYLSINLNRDYTYIANH